MDISSEFALHLFAAIAIGGGIYGFIKSEFTYGLEGGGAEDDRTLTGGKARLASALFAVSGGVLLVDTTIGICMLVGALVLPWLIGD